ncbi:hypothetical protein [Spirosoma linguale]|uniref:Uncharacterized protein n=1 Tax=Spirosoma linguale (strain ATCC 33905 / DSM 74 / LMG 10896 / Claus 1) TaxID=504472 RepID=D2QVV5_SPILD|nr:hypothetical protein Slin_6994 [Spirosoma linguale DSM 74]
MQRPAPATADQLEAAHQRPTNLDAEKFAAFAVKAIESELPTPQGIKAAVDAGVNTIAQAGVANAELIKQAGSNAVSQIEWAARSKANVLASQIGLSSWQSAALIFAGFLLLVVGAMLANQQREAALAQARIETQAVREFTDWVKSQPEGKRLYERYYHR